VKEPVKTWLIDSPLFYEAIEKQVAKMDNSSLLPVIIGNYALEPYGAKPCISFKE